MISVQKTTSETCFPYDYKRISIGDYAYIECNLYDPHQTFPDGNWIQFAEGDVYEMFYEHLTLTSRLIVLNKCNSVFIVFTEHGYNNLRVKLELLSNAKEGNFIELIAGLIMVDEL